MAPMASIDGRYVGPLVEDDAAELVSALKEGREPLPGRGLADPGFRLPWRSAAPPDRRPAEEPDVHPAGGTWEDAQVLDVPAGGRARSTPAARRPSRSTRAPAWSPSARGGGAAVKETRVLLANIDEPDLNTIDVYERARRLPARCARRCSR